MLLDVIRKDITPFFYVNTGTLFDLYTGVYRQGVNGSWVLDGGLSQALGIMGRGQTYKSGIAGSLLANALEIHKESYAYVYETEGTVSSEARYDDFVPKSSPVSDRILFKNTTVGSLTDFYEDFNKLVEEKLKNKKDYLVESPFIDPKTMKPYVIMRPTFVLIDSFSRASVTKGDEALNENAIDDSALNTLYMLNGNAKTKIMSDLPAKASKAGFYVILTAHVGDQISMNSFLPTPKQMQYMKQSDKLKNVGSNFTFLTTALIQTLKASVLQDSNKECLYPNKFSTPNEVNKVETAMVRCKNNASGNQLPFIMSQFQGILNSVTNFAYLRDNKDYGLIQAGNRGFSPIILPDATVGRKTLRDASETNYKLTRALELIAQLCFIQTCWNTWNLPEYVRMPVEHFAELLDHSEKFSVDRILNSTGVWSTSKQERERLTLMDILMYLDSEEKGRKIVVDAPKMTKVEKAKTA